MTSITTDTTTYTTTPTTTTTTDTTTHTTTTTEERDYQYYLIDAYRAHNRIILWIKTPQGNKRIVKKFSTELYLDATPLAYEFLNRHGLSAIIVEKRTYLRTWKRVFALPVPNISTYERFVAWIEKKTNYRVPLYNADIKPEQHYLYKHHLTPCTAINGTTGRIQTLDNHCAPPLTRTHIKIKHRGKRIERITLDDKKFTGSEHDLLTAFSTAFSKIDPDVILMENAFSQLPHLASRLEKHHITCPLHRWDPQPIRYRGGKSFYSYGRVHYQDYAIRLNGRFLIDTTSTVGSDCDIDSIIELTQLSGGHLQQIASRSYGAVFQQSLIRELIHENMLIPYKEKPLDTPLTLYQLLKTDRSGHTFDPKTGITTNVAEIDFCSMFPWIIYNYNISAETLLSPKGPHATVPGTPIRVSLRHRGIIPRAIKPLIDRRMYYKKNPTRLNKIRSTGLKYVLVTSYGYLRFREFKLGLASSHMAICAYARELLLKSAELAREHGFTVVHGIIDSLYITKKNMTEKNVRAFCEELEQHIGIPCSFEGIFKWIVFLNSVTNPHRPLPARYFGAFKDGRIKARGLEVRQKSSPLLIKEFQSQALTLMRNIETKHDVDTLLPQLLDLLDTTIKNLKHSPTDWLICKRTISTTHYKHNTTNKIIVEHLKQRGVDVQPGRRIHYIHSSRGPVLVDEYTGRPDIEHYRTLLIRALAVLTQEFGYGRERIKELLNGETQRKITDYYRQLRTIYIPLLKTPEKRKGLSERIARQKLEKNGWLVWRGGFIHARRTKELYPNVERKYAYLEKLLEKHHPGMIETLQYLSQYHHGMPDLLAYHTGTFKFVECKLEYEQLSKRQKQCITKLQEIGFIVEIHRVVNAPTKTRSATTHLYTTQKTVHAKQTTLHLFKTAS